MRNRIVTAVLSLTVVALGYKAIAQQKTDDATLALPVATFDQADTNRDGFVTPDEAVKVPGVSEQFSKLDTNRDGKLDPREYAARAVTPAR